MEGNPVIAPVKVVPRPRPREIVLDAFFVAIAIAFILGLTPPSSVEAQVPVAWRWIWYLLLLIGGGATLLSHTRRRWDDRLVWERHGSIATAAGCTIFAICAWSYAGWSATFAAGLMTAWAAAQVWRIIQIHRELYPPG